MGPLEVWIDDSLAWNGYTFYIRQIRYRDDMYVAKPIEMEHIPFDQVGAHHEPAFRLDKNSLQSMCDRIYQLGFRPSRAVDTDKAVEQAQENHIMDLNGVVDRLFKLLKK
jgi:hypothetical protein